MEGPKKRQIEWRKYLTESNIRLHTLVTFWQGKFTMVKHENNELRKQVNQLKYEVSSLGQLRPPKPIKLPEKKWFLCQNFHGYQELIHTDEYPKVGGLRGEWSSCTSGYNTKEDLFKARKILPNRCVECGNLVETCYQEPEQMIERNMCFSCNLWTNRIQSANRSNVMIVEGCMYTLGSGDTDAAGFKGFGGAEFEFRRLTTLSNATIKSKNVWFGGEIPNRFKERIPDNAIIIKS